MRCIKTMLQAWTILVMMLLIGAHAWADGLLTPAATSPAFPPTVDGYYAQQFGVKCDGVTDDTTALQSAINSAVSGRLIMPKGQCIISSPLTLPAAGMQLIGTGSGGNFATVIRPNNSQAFSVSGVHHSLIEKIQIWPIGSTPSAYLLRVTNSYNITFRDIRFHQTTLALGGGLPPTSAVISQDTSGGGTSNNILYENVIVRTDDVANWYAIAIDFGSGSGTAVVLNSDLETSNVAIQHDGGQITVLGLYTERIAVNALNVQPSADASAFLSINGGLIQASSSATPIALRAGAKNFQLHGTFVNANGGTYDGYIYDLTGSSNLVINPGNFTGSRWGGAVAYDPTKVWTPRYRQDVYQTITYSASMTIDASVTSQASITATNATAFTINAPTNPQLGMTLKVRIRNTSGVALGAATWNVVFKMGSAWTQPATGFSRSISFTYDGTNWIEEYRSAADVSN